MIIFQNGIFLCDDEKQARACKMRWNSEYSAYISKDWLPVAVNGLPFCDPGARVFLEACISNYKDSSCLGVMATLPKGENAPGDYLPFQKAGILMMSHRKVSLLADEPGLGKTIQAIGVANLCKWRKILVVCPASLKRNWRAEFLAWGILSESPVIIEDSKRLPEIQPSILLVNYDLLLSPNLFRLLKSWRYCGIVFDESHYLKNSRQRKCKKANKMVPISKRTKACILRNGLIENAEQCIFISGTSIKKRTKEIFSVCKSGCPSLLKPFGTYDSFGVKFCAGFKDRKRGGNWNFEGSSNLDELNFRLRAMFMIRRAKKDVLTQLPTKTLKVVPIKPGSKAVDALIEEEKSLVEYAEGSEYKLAKGVEVGQLEKLRQQLGISKVPLVIEYVTELLESNDKIFVIAHNREVIRLLKEGLEKFNPAAIQGGMTSKAKDEQVKKFRGDESCRVFIGQMIAAGVGITLIEAYTAVFAQASWVPGDMEQALDRLHRIGQEQPVVGHVLTYENSLEEYMIKSVGNAISNINQAMKGDLL